MKFSVRWLWPTAFACLLLSGIAGLAYQVAWARYLALFLGHTSYAVVAVLVAFMGGLALGNAWLGRYADRVSRPLALYAWMELGIAGYAWLFPVWFEACQDQYLALARGSTPGSPWLLGLKFAFSGLAILVPTTLMGGTLPVLTRLVTRSLGELRARVAGLYFINSAGAVLGVVLADFWWLPEWGLSATVMAGAVLNGVVGGVALLASHAMREGDEPWDAGAGANAEKEGGGGGDGRGEGERYATGELRLALAAAGASGFVAMLYEVVWTRLLALALGSSTHAFSLMLLTFISGIAVGAWWIGRWRGRGTTFDAFGWAELALAGTLLGSMFFYHWLPYAFARLGAMLVRTPGNYGYYQGLQFLICFAVMFVPATCLGMTLPLASRVATAELSKTGRSVGLVFSVNTLGTVLGAALTGMVLLPGLGLARTFAVGIGLNLAIALAVLTRRRSRSGWVMPALTGGCVAGLVALAHGVLVEDWERSFTTGLWRSHNPPQSMAEYRKMLDGLELRYYRDGAGSSVSVSQWTNPANQRVELALRVNGKVDATTSGDVGTQVLLAHLPLLLHPGARDVMVVGIGSGMTCGSALLHTNVQRIDAVEISPEVRDAARDLFGPATGHALENPRVNVVIDDAKSFLKAGGRKYDVIISEPSNPWMAGVAGVFTREFYETCRASLNARGLMVQWVHVYETDNRALETVLATFTSVFPFLTVWQTLPGDLVLVGSGQPLALDWDALERRFADPGVAKDLQRIDLFRLPVLLALQVLSEFDAPFVASPETPLHGDYHPTLEYLAGRGFFARTGADLHETFNETLSCRPATLLGDYLKRQPFTVADAQSLALLHTSIQLPDVRVVRSVIERWRELAPESTLPAEYSAKLQFPLPISELEAQRMARVREQLLADAGTNPEALRIYSRHLMHAYRYLRSAFHRPSTNELGVVLGRLIETDGVHRQSHLLRLAELAWDAGDDGAFFRLATEAFLPAKGAPSVGRFDLDYSAPGRVLYLVIETLWRARKPADALAWCRAAREQGYLQPGHRYYSAHLAMAVRKVEATVPEGGAGTSVAGGRGGP